jgi:hypothetical protein
VAIDPLLQANFRQRYDGYLDPLPEENTIADFAEFVPAEARAGNTYNFPLQASLEHGQTADITGLAYALNAARDSEMVNATLDGADLALVANVAYSSMLRGRNGANKGPGGSGGAYWQPFDLKIELMMKSMELYRELALLYGPGTGTSIAGSIGTLDATPITPGGGANLGVATNGVTARISAASWAPGIWNNMKWRARRHHRRCGHQRESGRRGRDGRPGRLEEPSLPLQVAVRPTSLSRASSSCRRVGRVPRLQPSAAVAAWACRASSRTRAFCSVSTR